jgi:aspartate 1-decarboxylase
MIRTFLRSAIHNATVTAAGAAWPVSLRLDPVLLRAADLLAGEQVEVVNVATGERIAAFVEAGDAGEVRVHAGVKHPVRAGDVISILCYGTLHDGQTLGHRMKIVTVDAANTVVSLTEMPAAIP